MRKRYRWISLDDTSREDQAILDFSSSGMRGHGTAICPDYCLMWRLEVDEKWITRSMLVSTSGAGWSRSLELHHDGLGDWSCRTSSAGKSKMAPPGFYSSPLELRDALDCDLGKCPVTNVIPIRRLRLLETEVPNTPLVMAWIDVPSLQVIRSDQVYGSKSATTVSYRSFSRDFAAELTVDSDGMIVEYPELASRVN